MAMGRAMTSMASTGSLTCLRRTVIFARKAKLLKYIGINKRNDANVYFSTPKCCRDCTQKSRRTRGKYRTIAIHTCEEARQRAHAWAETPEFAISPLFQVLDNREESTEGNTEVYPEISCGAISELTGRQVGELEYQ